MIRNNLATRPFYNVAAVRSWLAIAGVLVLAATVFNVAQVLRYSNSNTELVTRASNDEARAAELRTQRPEVARKRRRREGRLGVGRCASGQRAHRPAHVLVD